MIGVTIIVTASRFSYSLSSQQLTHRQTHIHADKQTDRQSDIQTDRQSDIQTHRHTHHFMVIFQVYQDPLAVFQTIQDCYSDIF